LAFAIGGLLPLLSIVPAWCWLAGGGVAGDSLNDDEPVSLRGNFLGFGTAWAQGFLEGGMVTFLSVYLIGLGHSETVAGGLMAVLFLGVVAFQIPVAWMADRRGRVRVLLVCHGVVLTGLLLIPLFVDVTSLGILLFLVGGSCAALYPLGLALLGERLAPSALGRANAWYLACNCGGSLTGPVVMGLAMKVGGAHALFSAGAASVALVVIGWAIGRRSPSGTATALVLRMDCRVSRRAA
jgi:MFS family permease